MQIQSLSIVVPTEKCVNDCAFCVSKQHSEDYGQNRMAFTNPEIHKAIEDYKKRLAYARDNNCNAVMLTGDAEPTQNRAFLTLFGLLNESLSKPFRHISIQTAGAFLDQNYIEFLRDHVGVNTVSLSISSFVYDINTLYTGAKAIINIQNLCAKIKEAGLNLRISLNMTDRIYGDEQPEPAEIFKYVNHYLGADQITFRVLYEDLEKKFSEKYGENAVKEVKKEIAEEKELRQKVDKYALNSSEKFKIWEPYSEQWIYADLKDILWVELCANKRLLQMDTVYLDSILHMFGLKGNSKSMHLGWSYDDEMFTEGAGYYGGAWIELAPQIIDNPDGTHYYQLEYGIHPNDISYLNDSGPLPF